MFLYLCDRLGRRQVQVRDSLQRIQKSDVLHRKPHSAQQRCGGRGASGFSKSSKFWTPFLHRGVTNARCSSLLPSTAIDSGQKKRRNVLISPLVEEYVGVAPAEIERLRWRLISWPLSLHCRRVTAPFSSPFLRYCGYSNARSRPFWITGDAERAQAHPACRGKTQRSAEVGWRTVVRSRRVLSAQAAEARELWLRKPVRRMRCLSTVSPGNSGAKCAV